jgi:ribose transport system substrate-binding protein
MLLRALTLVLLTLLMTACDKGGGNERATGSGPAGSGAAAGKLRIAVIPKGTTHEFWKAVHAGAVKASKELDVEVVWKGPLKEDDLKQQIDLVQSFTAQGVSGIVLAPLNDKALVKSVKDATRSKIPVVVFDSALQGKNHSSFVATDNRKAGALAGERMSKLLDGKGKVLILRYQEGSASTSNREEGFLEGVKKSEGIEVVSDNQYGGATTESAFTASESLLIAQKAADGGVDGIFCPNESTTFGMLLALQKLSLAGKIKFLGFDASEKLIKALQAGELHGLVLQDPFSMGYIGVKTLVSHILGEKIPSVIDTGSTMVDSDNMKKPEVAALLRPPLDKWLGNN